MCGLVGMASTSLTIKDREAFSQMLLIDQIRGKHSTGVVAVNRDKHVFMYKRALPAADMINLRHYDNIVSEGCLVLMGHNRHATCGARTDDNAHPFIHGHIILMHNGTLTEKKVHTDNSTFSTDSESIAYSMAHDGVLATLERIEGAYALVWYDTSNHTLNFARNNERTLYIAYTNTGDLWWASEQAILDLVAEHNNIVLKSNELYDTGLWTAIPFEPKEEVQETKFTIKKRMVATPQGTGIIPVQAGRGMATTSKIGQDIEGWIYRVKDTGFIQAATVKGEVLECVVPKDKIGMFREAKDSGSARIKGKVRTTSYVFKQNRRIETFYLNPDSVELIKNSWNEITCYLCHQPLTEEDDIETHYGRNYHSLCLDIETVKEGRSCV